MAKQLAIEIEDLSIGYGKGNKAVVVADSISLKLKPASLYGLIGINGSGKSTLIKTLSGALNPLSGEFKLQGEYAHRLTMEARAKMLSVVLTKSPVSLNLSCYELVALGRHPYTNWVGKLTALDKEAIYDALEKTDLTALKDKKCYQLSDGQLQRALLARAIAQDTPIIILDEPTTHLDLHHKFNMLKLMHQLAREGKTVLYATHDLEQALDLCDSILLVKDKRIASYSREKVLTSGVLESLFPKETVRFDAESKRFFLNK